MNLLDWLLLLLVAAYALSGYWQGFITGAFATIGLLSGGLGGILLAPLVLGGLEPSLAVSLGALFIVILCASLGQALLQYAGARVRERITWQPARAVDAVGGALLSAFAVLLVAWALGVAISGTRIGPITSMVRSSAILAKVNEALPESAPTALQAFNNVVGTGFFPRYLEPFAPEQIVEVAPGPSELPGSAKVKATRSSVVKIRGANRCGRGVEGTGFVIAQDRVMTNAHVVAGVEDPEVSIGGGTELARVVHYDRKLDIAVLALETDDTPVLAFDRSIGAGDAVAIVGYPQDGPFDVQTARVRAKQNLRSPDIYGDGTVVREVYSLRGLVRPGNSGGPIVTPQGKVAGVVFAASVTDPETGYALTAQQVSGTARAGVAADAEVNTGNCAS
ncbi:MarP family serine protease [Pimelobacter simplex]|uniref:Putative serine protease n=1 Tax=Nocardioides simplex TaxID=2045 RepID=A0A0A1DKX6_NOCSI|nr:MarP family serine protease [Pimelobacter simplex]AIY15995.1 putative serine protease [Pimelobacter simplex]MCG8150986.1 MarP family serine protease [Pimelobacter simplex]GEB12381.1 serine protease [Pimelobacter simplex]SFM95771.1 Colicin V production protein [Pimelobacter simplex]